MVDFVLIDNHEKPLSTLLELKPEFFAKGYEYNKEISFNSATKEEEEVLNSYGGEIIFTPGDVVYSSSNILNIKSPNLFLEKLLVPMRNQNVSFNDLKLCLDKIKNKKVHIIGDLIIDTILKQI